MPVDSVDGSSDLRLRVTSPSRDELQNVMAFLREQDYGIELTFGNYR